MKIKNNNHLDLAGNNGETISVEVQSKATVHGVNYSLDNQDSRILVKGNTLKFTLDKATNDPSILVMTFTFAGNGNGKYDVKISGSNGGDISNFTVSQFDGEATDSIAYTFDVI
jgi:hypothetical protein